MDKAIFYLFTMYKLIIITKNTGRINRKICKTRKYTILEKKLKNYYIKRIIIVL